MLFHSDVTRAHVIVHGTCGGDNSIFKAASHGALHAVRRTRRHSAFTHAYALTTCTWTATAHAIVICHECVSFLLGVARESEYRLVFALCTASFA